MHESADTAIILVAGGRGVRFGREAGKQLAEVAGLPVAGHSLTACLGVARAGLVVVVCDPERVAEYAEALAGLSGTASEVRFIAGGERRQDSVAAGLAEVPEGRFAYIAVHDGARPLASPETFDSALDSLATCAELAGVVVGHPSFDTLKIVDGMVITETPDRSLYWVAQTPQVFREPVLRRAYAEAARVGREGTDDSSLVEATGGVVGVVEGPRDNIKVTVTDDLRFVEGVLAARRGGESR